MQRALAGMAFAVVGGYLCIPCVGQDGSSSNVATGCTLRIHVDGLRNSTGVVGSVIFKSPDGWPEDKEKAFRHGPTPIPSAERTATVVWENLPPGNYGVAAIHDENRNAKLDRNIIGIPKEGFGFANNPHVGLSAPPFQSAIVHVVCPETETTIHLQYRRERRGSRERAELFFLAGAEDPARHDVENRERKT